MHFNMIEPDSSCCNSEYLCGENEGDCDTDSQCKDGLRCGIDNCGDGWPDSTWDCIICEVISFNKSKVTPI